MKSHPPGPNDRMLGFRTLTGMKSDVLGTYGRLHQEYGDCVSFVTGPYRLNIFFHPDHVREVLVTQAKSLIRLPRVMKVFAQWNGQSTLIVEGDAWIRQRRLVQPAFHPRRMRRYGDIMVHCADHLSDSWKPTIQQQGYIDVDTDATMTAMTLAIICKAMFGQDVRQQSDDISKAVKILSECAFYEMQAFVRWPNWIPTRANLQKRWAIDVLDRAIWGFVREARKDTSPGDNLLASLMHSVDADSGQQLADRQIRDEATTLMLAGHDTTAAAFDWVWYAIAKHPEVLARCQAEIDGVLGNRVPTTDDIVQLRYVEATIKEALRLYPPAIGVFLRQATSPIQIGGYDLPKGSLVTVSSFVTQRDPRWFPDPLRFAPERFLAPHLDRLRAGAYFPFGGGPRVCIGQSFAMTELTLIVARLLQSHRVALPPGAAEPEFFVHMALRPKDKLIVRWSHR